jgi:hypothetical protein
MAITSALCASFKVEILEGIHNFTTGAHVFKVALYGSVAALDQTTTTYTATGEISGAGYTAGGLALTNVTPVLSGNTAVVTFANPTWSTATFTAYGALIYNSTAANRAVAVLSFGGPYAVTAGNFTLQWPAADMNNAIVRIA